VFVSRSVDVYLIISLLRGLFVFICCFLCCEDSACLFGSFLVARMIVVALIISLLRGLLLFDCFFLVCEDWWVCFA
jgi:hypothetical protein